MKTALKGIVLLYILERTYKNRIDTSSRFCSRSPRLVSTALPAMESHAANVSSCPTQPLFPSQHRRLRCSSRPPIHRCSPCPASRSASSGSGVVSGGWTSANVSHHPATLILLENPSSPTASIEKGKSYMCAQRPTTSHRREDRDAQRPITTFPPPPPGPHNSLIRPKTKEKKTHSYLIPSNRIPSQHLPAPQHHGRLMPPLPVLPHLVVARPSRFFTR